METLKRFWNWLLGKTTIDEKIEEKVDNAKRTIIAAKVKVNKVVEEVKDVIEAVEEAREDILDEVHDVVEAVKSEVVIKGKVTKSKLNALKKEDLLQHADEEFGEKFDSKITKSNLVNKIYTLHKNR